jgi:protoporphyrinogen oxidase
MVLYPKKPSSLLGKDIDKSKSYIIVGAGISGLLLGYHFKKANISFKIVECSKQVGGILQTEKTRYGLVEKAANGFIWCPEIQMICDDLGLEILSPQTESKARYILKNKKLRKIPLSVFDSFKLIRGLLKKHPEPFKTIEDFGRYFFGEKITNQVITPAFAGIYGASLHQLSFPATMKKIAEGFNETPFLIGSLKRMRSGGTDLEKKKRGSGTHSFKGGMSELTAKLSEFLNEYIELGVDGDKYKNSSENLIITTPAYIAKDFFKDELHHHLKNVAYNSMLSSTLFFKKSSLKKFKSGFGCLIPPNEGLTIIGILFNSCIFKHRVFEEDVVSLTCMIRDDSKNKELLHKSDSDITSLILNDLREIFGDVDAPLEANTTRWEKGFPLYSPHLYESWFEMDSILKTKYPNRNLFCNYTGDISIRAMSQAVAKFS